MNTPIVIDHTTGKPYPVHIQPRLNAKIVNNRPTSQHTQTANATWYEVLLALLALLALCVACAVGVSTP